MAVFLETDRMMLRPFDEDDVDLLVALDSDPEVVRFINGGKPTSRETVVERKLPRLMHRYPCIDAPGFWAAEEQLTGEFLGWFEFRPLDEHSADVVELGYRLRRAGWGHGYATEGTRVLIRHGFTRLGVQRVTANTMAVNTGSRRVMEKAGLTYVRTYFGEWTDPIEGSEHGEVEYALTRSEWEARESDRRQ